MAEPTLFSGGLGVADHPNHWRIIKNGATIADRREIT